jgi:hypothetical protein
MDTEFTRTLHLFLSWARPIQSIPPYYLPSTHLNIIKPPMSWSSTNNLYAFLVFPIRATCSTHLILLDLIILIILQEKYTSNLIYVWSQYWEKGIWKNFVWSWLQWYPTIIITVRFIALFANWDNNRLLLLLRQFFLIPNRINEFMD